MKGPEQTGGPGNFNTLTPVSNTPVKHGECNAIPTEPWMGLKEVTKGSMTILLIATTTLTPSF